MVIALVAPRYGVTHEEPEAALASEAMSGGLGPTTANTIVGAASATVDNIPVMFAVLSMGPEMPDPGPGLRN